MGIQFDGDGSIVEFPLPDRDTDRGRFGLLHGGRSQQIDAQVNRRQRSDSDGEDGDPQAFCRRQRCRSRVVIKVTKDQQSSQIIGGMLTGQVFKGITERGDGSLGLPFLHE